MNPPSASTLWHGEPSGNASHTCAPRRGPPSCSPPISWKRQTACSRVVILHRGTVAALGTPAALKATLGGDETTLDDVFVHYAGGVVEEGGEYREITRARRTAQRLG